MLLTILSVGDIQRDFRTKLWSWIGKLKICGLKQRGLAKKRRIVSCCDIHPIADLAVIAVIFTSIGVLYQRMKTLAISHRRKEQRLETIIANELSQIKIKFQEEEDKMIRRQEVRDCISNR